ncbi:MAG TPA: energy transducer TonB [Burkholderiales bacterium]|nr:energy transducer TonB [Burkholderiales bacterium]
MSADALAFPLRREPALLRSFVLAAAMHAALIAVMFLGVRFQSHPPATVEVELWDTSPPPPPQAEVKPEVKPEPPPPPPPKVEPEKPVAKPDIAVQKKPEPKPKPKAKPEPKRDRDFEKRMREQLAMEQKSVAEQDAQRKERELKALIAKREADARSRALAAWQDKIRGKIRGNIILPQGIPGNPEAIFDVALLPTGEVLSVKQRRSSGHPAYDEAVYRAILKSSPLPKPDNPALFERQLELRFRPLDK